MIRGQVYDFSLMENRPRLTPPRAIPSLVDVAYEAVVEAILSNRFRPETRITIDQIARDLRISITPVREALARVAANGLLVQIPNRGFAVAPLLTSTTYHQLFAIRRLLETHAAAHARPTAEDLRGLERAHKRMAALKPSADYAMYRRFNQLDGDFHRRVVALGANPYVDNAWRALHFHLQMSRLYAGEGVIDHADAAREHATIIRALSEGDTEGAAHAVCAHIDGAERRLVQLVPGGDVAEPADGTRATPPRLEEVE